MDKFVSKRLKGQTNSKMWKTLLRVRTEELAIYIKERRHEAAYTEYRFAGI